MSSEGKEASDLAALNAARAAEVQAFVARGETPLGTLISNAMVAMNTAIQALHVASDARAEWRGAVTDLAGEMEPHLNPSERAKLDRLVDDTHAALDRAHHHVSQAMREAGLVAGDQGRVHWGLVGLGQDVSKRLSESSESGDGAGQPADGTDPHANDVTNPGAAGESGVSQTSAGGAPPSGTTTQTPSGPAATDGGSASTTTNSDSG
jgi:hypothetical protein